VTIDDIRFDARRGALVPHATITSTLEVIEDIADDMRGPVREFSATKTRRTAPRSSSRMIDCLRDALRQGGVIRRSTTAGVWKTVDQEWATGTVLALLRRGWVRKDQGRYLVTDDGRRAAAKAEEVARG